MPALFRSLLVPCVAVVALADPAAAQLRTSASQLPRDSPFRGGVPAGGASATPMALTIADVLERALINNLAVVNSEIDIERARGTARVATSSLLPQFGGRVNEVRQKTNLEAFGLPVAETGLPKVVGPYNVFDARLYASQTVLDFQALNESRSEGHNERAARFMNRSRRDQIAMLAAEAYLQVLAADARVVSARAQRDTSQALFTQAQDLKESGIVAGIDVLRAQVRLAGDTQRVTGAEHDAQKTRLDLARMIGLPLGQMFTLSERLPELAMPDITVDQAVERAYMQRPDYLAAAARVEAAEANRRAARGESLPIVRATADYGAIGLTPASSLATFSVAGSVTVPIFQGGRDQGHVIEADAELRGRKAEADNLRAGIYYDIHNAFLDLQATEEELRTATGARDLAQETLTQARDRFQAGVSNNVEVVQAQQALTLADEEVIDATFGFLIAKAMLAGSMGTAEQEIRRFVEGVK